MVGKHELDRARRRGRPRPREAPSGDGAAGGRIVPLAAACSAAAVLAAGIATGAHQRGPTPAPFAIDVFRSPTGPGYGYEISMEEGARIRQPHVPALPGHAGFASAEDARTVAEFVARRMRTGALPTVSLEELDSLGVWTDQDPDPTRKRE